MDAHEEVALVAASIGEDPERVVRFARRRLEESGVTMAEFASALRAMCRRGVKLEVTNPIRPLASAAPRALAPGKSRTSSDSGSG